MLAANATGDLLEIDMSRLATDKPIARALAAGGKILETQWDAFARTDLVDPADGNPPRIFVDGAAASIMPSPSARSDLIRDIGFFPFATEQPERVFIIGPGAGLDVWFALQSGARSITAVEVNPASVNLVDQWRGYNGDVYRQPSVTVVVDDGRSALRRSDEAYDLIYLSQVVTLAAEIGGYALSENTIYTADAFTDYLRQLNPAGMVALKLYDEITLTRSVSTAVAALNARGLTDRQALNHLMAFVDERVEPAVPLLLLGKQAFTEDDSLVLGAIARDVGFTPLLLPHILVQPPLDAVASGAQSYTDIVRAFASDISAPTDDRPYFFQFERGIPGNLIPLAIIAALVSLAPASMLVYRWRVNSAPQPLYAPAFFALLGVGFIAVEIYAIQQTRLFLGHPTLAITLVLAVFLVGGGLGSGLSARIWREGLERRAHWVTALVALLAILWSLTWNGISQQLVSADIVTRCLFVGLSLLPLSLCMGVPFPQALARVGRLDKREVALAWSINGLMTVVGTVLAVILSITVGFRAVAAVGVCAYLLATLVLIFAQGQEV